MAVGFVGLLILLLLRLGVIPTRPPRESRPPNFTLLPAGEKAAPVARPRTARRAAAASRTAPLPPPPPVPMPVPTPAPTLALSREAFAATDIGRMTRAPSDDADGEEGADTAVDTAAVAGPGEGPGGARLYNAQWYREPPAGALALYLPGGPQPGWATIACRTEPRFKVGNCRELDESPRGSGLSRALRQAAWQFQVRPPRLGGKPLIGAWVRIRFDFSARKPG